ncbi:ATP-binding protein [Rhodospirillum centenum]|uniref:histidine kinase n=1 Tax=Rhodospirillum centenum (strain ATCC 51521 / SW) TaxID=414684 RepID=B6IYM2_RHOCS|nr:ATP-binding protein [Rhodospirillum centenum]ACJ01396.1 cell cycle histidine kinase CckA [Rhodospirillum centenum SW]
MSAIPSSPTGLEEVRLSSAALARRLTLLYVPALVLLALLASTKFITTSLVVEAQEVFAEVINSAGRQRMKSQRLLVLVHDYLDARDEATRSDRRAAVEDLIDRMLAAHDRLLGLSLPLAPLVEPSTDLQRLYRQPPHALDLRLHGYIDRARALLDLPAGSVGPDDPAWEDLRQTGTGPLLEALEAAVQFYEDEAERNLAVVRQVELAVWLVTLLLLLVLAVAVFRPMVGLVRRNTAASEQVETRLLSESARQSQDIADEKSRNAAILDTVPDAILTLDQEGRITSANRATETMFGWDAAALDGQPFSVLIAGGLAEDAGEAGRPPDDLLRSGGGVRRLPRELEGRRRNGTPFPVDLTVTAARLGGRSVHIAMLRDLTLRRAGEEREAALRGQLQQADKLRTVGTLAGGIAHDFNNVLTPILGYADLLLSSLPEGSQDHEDVEVIHRAARRARDIVAQMLAFSRPGSEALGPVPVADAVAESVKLLRSSLPPTVRLTVGPVPPGLRIRGDAGRLQQVLVNLIKNAGDALQEEGGRIAVDVGIVLRPDATAEGGEAGMRRCAAITVTDDGPGMPDSVCSRVFEPFFTTKPAGRGTGLGLSVAYGIISAWGGDIAVRSAPGEGTTFTIHLPLAGDDGTASVAGEESVTPAFRGAALVVDDDPDVRIVACRLLRRLGLEVAAAADIGEALADLERRGLPPDLLLTDHSMPGGSVRQLIAAARAAGVPRVIQMSGFELGVEAGQIGADVFVRKPLALASLADALIRAGVLPQETIRHNPT